MLWFLGSIVIFIGVAIIMISTGLLIISLFHNRQTFRFLRPDEIALSAIVGTAFWMLLSGTLSYLGFSFIQIRLALILVVVLIGLFLFFRRFNDRFHPRDVRRIGLVIALAFLGGSASLLPLILKNTFNVASDAAMYITLGDFLQTHNFITPIQANISFPYLQNVAGHQITGLRMGANFFLALITSWTVDLRAIDVYPATLAWGVTLNLFSLWLWMRWGLRASYRVTFLAMFFLAVTPNAIQVSGVLGFFPQTFGTAIFLFAMAVLTRVVRSSNFSIKLATLLGISWACLLSAYSELFPFLGLVSIVSFFFAFLRSYKKKRVVQFSKTVALSLIVWVVLSHYELYRFANVILIQINSVVGWDIHQNLLQLWGAALSAKPVEVGWNWGFMLAEVTLSCLFLLGLWRIIIKKQVVALSILGIFLLLAIYYWFTKDLNSQKSLWSVYKITQWSSPFLVSLAFLALQPFKFQKLFNLIVVASCLTGIVPLIFIFNQIVEPMQYYTSSKTPVQDYFQLVELLKQYKKTITYQVSSPGEYWQTTLPMYFFMDTPFQGNWSTKYMIRAYIPDKLPNVSDTVFYCVHCPFPNPRNPLLPANAVLIQQPVIYDVQNVADKNFVYKLLKSKLIFRISQNDQRCVYIFSVASADATIEFKVQRSTSQTPPTIKITNKKGWEYKTTAIIEPDQAFKIPIRLALGNNSLCFVIDRDISTISIDSLYLNP